MLPEPVPPPPRRRLAPALLSVLVVVLVAAGLAVVAVRDGDGEGETSRAGPSTSSVPTSVAPEPAPGEATAEPGTSGESAVPSGQRKAFDQLMAEVAGVRGLAWKEPLNLRVVSNPELGRRVREVIARDTDPALLAAEEATLKLLGLLPPSLDYGKLIEDLLAEQVVGFYDPATRELFVGSSGDDEELDAPTRWVIAHEMTHALTDQHFSFGPKTLELEKTDKVDQLSALVALLEGDAVLSQTLWAEKHLDPQEQLAALFGAGEGNTEVLSRTPEYVRQSLFFPYEDGLAFVERLHSAGGFAAVDAAYRMPPTSTEHVLHPSTYSAGDGSASPTLPDVAAATGCAGVRLGTLGEFDMRALLDQHLPAGDASEAAQGWNGDAYTLVRCGTALGLADRWQADSDSDARQLADALGQWSREWSGARSVAADGRFSGPSGAGRIVRSGGRVDLVVAENADTADKLSRALG